MGAEFGVVLESEVVLQDGGDEAGKAWVSGKGCEVKGVLAIAIRVIEADAFRRVAEPVGLHYHPNQHLHDERRQPLMGQLGSGPSGSSAADRKAESLSCVANESGSQRPRPVRRWLEPSLLI